MRNAKWWTSLLSMSPVLAYASTAVNHADTNGDYYFLLHLHLLKARYAKKGTMHEH